MAIAVLGLGLALSGCNEQKSAQTNAPAVKAEVSAVSLHPQSVAITAELPGRTSPYLVAEVRPQVGGIIRSRNFREGSEVEKGDLLYEIDPAAYQAAYDSAEAALQRAKGAVPSAQAKLDRYTGLSAQSAVSKQEFDDARASLVQAQADVASATAALEAAKINLGFTKIVAPISGRVDASTVTVGALVTANQTTTLTTIREFDPINVDVTQSSANLLKFRRAVDEGRLKISGDNVSVHLTLEDGSSYNQTGKLQFSEAAVAETVGTITVRVDLPEPRPNPASGHVCACAGSRKASQKTAFSFRSARLPATPRASRRQSSSLTTARSRSVCSPSSAASATAGSSMAV